MQILAPFQRHPASVGETYGQHLAVALRFAGEMLRGGGACFIHAFLPFLFVTTGSDTVKRLHATMVTGRREAARGARPHPLETAE